MIGLSRKLLFAIEAVLEVAHNGGGALRSAEITDREGIPRRAFIVLAGAAASWPLATSAQLRPTIGFLGSTLSAPYAPALEAFRQGLADTGYVEGQNLAIEYRWAEGSFDRLPQLAANLVARNVDVIVTSGGNVSALAAKAATSSVPIVFLTGGDPIGAGLVTNLARPSGNATGITFMFAELTPKRLELLSELVPQARVIVHLVNPLSPGTDRVISEVEEAGRIKGIKIPVLKASTEAEIDAAFAALRQLHADAMLIGADPFIFSRRDQLLALASRHGVPTMYQYPDFASFGGLIAYGSSVRTAYRQMGIYAGRILKGEKPADLPVQQPTTFELAINLKTAKALGLTVPLSLLQRADEVIE